MLNLGPCPPIDCRQTHRASAKSSSRIGWKPVCRSPRVASARLRCLRPLALLQRGGFPAELFRNSAGHRYRVVVLQKLYDVEHLDLARRFKAQGTSVVLDICDNLLYNPHGDRKFREDADQLRRMLDFVDAVTVPTKALAESLPRTATIIPDGLDSPPVLSRLGAARLRTNYLELVWFGNSGCSRAPLGQPNLAAFGMRDLLSIAGALEEVSRYQPIRLTVISNSRATFQECIAPLPFPTRYREWRSHGNLCRLLRLHDLCVLPVRLNPFTLCKSPNRLTLSLSLNVPVVATSIPSYEEFRPFCVLDDWRDGLRAAVEDQAALRNRTENGRAYVLQHHSAANAANNWRGYLQTFLD